MAVFIKENISVADFRDYGYYVDANEKMIMIDSKGNYLPVTAAYTAQNTTQGEVFVLESERYGQEISVFSVIEESRGVSPSTSILGYNCDSNESFIITKIEQDEIEKTLYLS